ncbi:Calponin homology domain-containing protein [Cynara cardunculus var. scolymus]|uniref:Calponin homology domain-containing protein n=1 Tax=Cynara cardunculus var. scolymus TaxID=59895 RepID=A0A118K7N2_CYNCS|nr:Calponin homology domain-containing protein [Cynara cardunculus var. scolymus]
MMAAEGALSFSVASVMEDVLHQHDNRPRDLDLDSRRAEEAATRRYEATAWLRKMIGVVGARDLPAQPSEEEFRLALRSGLILCYVINKVDQGAVPKVVESPCDSAAVPDGAALSIYQCFENVRNFLVAVEQMGLPTFEASDLEQGGKSSRIVNCILALKSYNEWKQTGGNGAWKFGGNLKPITFGKNFIRKNSEPFKNSLSRNMSMNETSMSTQLVETENSKMPNSSLNMLVRAVLSDKKPDEVPMLIESVLSKVMEEFEHRIASQFELLEDKKVAIVEKEQNFCKNSISDEERKRRRLKYQMAFDGQERNIKELKQILSTTKAGMQFMQMKFHEEIQNFGLHIHGLASAASGYHRVLEENRKLYNQVQDLKGNIRVYCRVRPSLGGRLDSQSVVDNIEEGMITINTPAKYGKGCRSFNFNKVFGPSATQAEVFADTRPLVRSVLDGYNVCIFAYGQTGSGKTHTMTGPKDLTENSQGVNYRALSDLFFLAEQRKDTLQYDVSVQMIEIYNEQVRDLLVTEGSERVDKSEVAGDRLKEAQHINKSLSALGDAKTLMFVHISPELNAVGETLSTLKFAERVATVELGAAQVHKDSSDVKDLKEQIANLKAALAKKEGDQEHKVSGSPAGKLSSRSPPNLQRGESYPEPKSRRKPRADVANFELLANSPPWPPISSPGETYLEDDRDIGSGDWIDKVMVNKQDAAARCWEAENAAGMSDAFYQKLYSEQSYNNLFQGGNGFDVATTDGADELDAATSDSSEPDLLWQFNSSKHPTLTNGTMSRFNNNSNAKPTKNPDMSSRSMIPRIGGSASRKATTVGSQPNRGGRPVTGVDMKKKSGNRK